MSPYSWGTYIIGVKNKNNIDNEKYGTSRLRDLEHKKSLHFLCFSSLNKKPDIKKKVGILNIKPTIPYHSLFVWKRQTHNSRKPFNASIQSIL